MTLQRLYIALPQGSHHGWGICGTYLRRHLAEHVELVEVSHGDEVDGVLFQALEGVSLNPITTARGTKNVGYVFFENTLTAESLANASKLDLILGGSSWCTEQMKRAGIAHVQTLIQGIDPEQFFPTPLRESDGRFVLFSGGKFELRKGQDIVLKAMAQLQDEMPDLHLLTAWDNAWQGSLETMKASPHIRFELQGSTWREQLHYLCLLNGINPARVQVCPLVPHHKMRAIYSRTDCGIFPNRCEGGTNLVLMEYMACGRAVIASPATGHGDLVNASNAYVLDQLTDTEKIIPNQGQIQGWQDASLAQVIEMIKKTRSESLQPRAEQGAKEIGVHTWEAMAKKLLAILESLT